MGLCRKVEKWFDGLNFGFSHLHDYLGLHDYPGLKSTNLTLHREMVEVPSKKKVLQKIA